MAEDNIYHVTVEKEHQGTRIDLVLSAALEDTSRSYIQKMIEDGNVKINGNVCLSKKEKVDTGNEIEIAVPEPKTISAEPEDIPIDIVYEDDDVIVVNKPKGMVVHPAPGNESGTLVNALMFHCGSRLSTINGVIRPGIVHRIDKDTSGLLMVAKTDTAHRRLAKQLEEHSLLRGYRAVVFSNIKQDSGRIDAPIGRDPANRLRMAVTEHNSKNAVTNYKVTERFGKFTAIEAHLETGRTHQIRVHMAYIKHPLLGDRLYGSARQPYGADGQMLHAYQLGFIHPSTGEQLEFIAQPPQEFTAILEKIRKDNNG